MTTTTSEEPSVDWASLNDEELATSYMTCRNRKDAAEAAADRADKVMRQIKDAMLARMNAAGTTGYKVAGVATVTRTLKKNVSCADWSLFLPWLLDRASAIAESGGNAMDVFAFLHRRVATGAVEDYMAANGGVPPPAINIMQEYDVSVRRATP